MYREMTSEILMGKLQEGDLKAYAFLFDEHYAALCNYCHQLSGNRSLSEDLVQDVFLRIWEQKDRLRVTSSFKSYLFKSCHNQFLMYLRKERMQRDLLDKIAWTVLLETYSEEAYHVKRDRLYALIEKLPPRCREIFVKHKLENRKYREIALEMEISIKTVEAQMSKALHFLKRNATSLFL